MYSEELSVKELYASISDVMIIRNILADGLRIKNVDLAITAMEELIARKETDIVQRELEIASSKGYIEIGSAMRAQIAITLKDNLRRKNFLHEFGKFLLKAKTDNPFEEFINSTLGEFDKDEYDLLNNEWGSTI